MRKIDEMTLKEIQEKIRTNRIIIIKRYCSFSQDTLCSNFRER